MQEEKLDLIFDENLVEQEELEYGTFWNRFWAYLADSLFLLSLTALSAYFYDKLQSSYLSIIITIISVAYKPIMEGLFGWTLGKRFLHLKVIKENRNPMNLNTAIIRYIPWTPSLLLGIFFILLHHNNGELLYQFNGGKTLSYVKQSQWMRHTQISFYIIQLICGISIAFSDNKQGFHDRLAKTLCVKDA